MIGSIFSTLLLLLILYFLHVYILSPWLRLQKYRKQGVPNVYFFPIAGIYYYFSKYYMTHNDSLYFVKEFAKNYPNERYIISNLGKELHFLFIHPQNIREFLVKHNNHIRMTHDGPLVPLLGTFNLLSSEGEGWKIRRKMHSFGFAFDNISKITPTIAQIAENSINSWDISSGNISEKLIDFIGEFMVRIFMGSNMQERKIEGKSLQNQHYYLLNKTFDRQLSQIYNVLGTRIFYWLFPKEKEIDRKCNELHQVVTDEIEKMKSEAKMEGTMKNVKEMKLLEYMIEHSKTSNINLTTEFMLIITGGIETSSQTIVSALEFLAKNQIIVQKLRKEINETLVSEEDFNYDKINSMVYLAAVVKEVLRLRNPLPLTPHKILDQDIVIEEHLFKKNTIITAGLVFNSYKAQYFKDPECFKPERWISEGKVKENINDEIFSYLPFSTGPRNCIGQHLAVIQIKIILTKIIKKYDVSLKNKDKLIKWKLSITYGPDEPILFDLIPIV